MCALVPPPPGFWRGDISRTFIRECPNPSACAGGRGINASSPSSSPVGTIAAASSSPLTTAATATATSDGTGYLEETRYCVEGHKGAYCSVCAEGYRRLSGGQQLCVSCGGGWSRGARTALWVLGVLSPLLVLALMVFLVSGLAALTEVREGQDNVAAKTPAGLLFAVFCRVFSGGRVYSCVNALVGRLSARGVVW